MLTRVLSLVLVLLLAVPASAQVSGPAYVFTAGTVANPDEVNTNFSAIYNAALNRLGGTMAGALIFSPDNTYDIGASGATRPRDFFLGRNAAIAGTLSVTGAATFGTAAISTLTCTGCVGATQIASTAVSAASYGSTTAVPTFTVDADGRLTAAATTATSALTGIAEGGITDGSILARLAADETVTGAWTYTGTAVTVTTANPQILLRESDGGTNAKVWRVLGNTEQFLITLLDDSNANSATALAFSRTGTTMGTATFGTTAVLNASGSAAAPGYSFTGDDNTGLWRTGADSLGLATGGTNRVTLSTSALTSTVGYSGTTGTFSGALQSAGYTGTTGTFSGAVSALSLSLTNAIQFPDGSFSTPAIAFTGDTDSGLYRVGDNNVGLAVGGGVAFQVSTTQILAHENINAVADTFSLGESGARWATAYLVSAPDVSSDARLKDDIVPHAYGLAFVRALAPKTYTMAGAMHYGFLAQQVLEVAPDFAAVNQRNPDRLSMRYEELLPAFANAIRELADRIDRLEGGR